MSKTTNKDLQITMTELKTDLKYIKKALEDNEQQHSSMMELLQKHIEETEKKLEKKADRIEVNALRNWFLSALLFVITLLLSVLGYLLSKILFKGV